MATKPQTTLAVKQTSTKSSITGTVLALLALGASGFGWVLVHLNFHSKQPLTDTSQKVGDAVGSTTGHVLGSIVAVPFLCIGIALAIAAALFILRRLGKVKAGGLFASIIWLLVSIWAFSLAVSAFHLLKAHA